MKSGSHMTSISRLLCHCSADFKVDCWETPQDLTCIWMVEACQVEGAMTQGDLPKLPQPGLPQQHQASQ